MFIGFTQDNGHGYWWRTFMKHSSSVRGACVSYADFPYASFLLHSGTDTKFEDVLHHFNLWNWGGKLLMGCDRGL